MLHDVGNNRDCDVDVDHRNNTRNSLRTICAPFMIKILAKKNLLYEMTTIG